METWHYVAIGAVVVVAGVVYYRRRNRKAAQTSAKVREGVAAYNRLKAAGIKTAADPIDYTEALSTAPGVTPGTQAGGAVEFRGFM